MKNAKALAGYPKQETEEFKVLLDAKLADARSDLDILKAHLESMPNDAKGDDVAGEQLSRTEVQQLGVRQRNYISRLEEALERIAHGTYGLCRNTGTLIPKERLRLVPQTVFSIVGKLDEPNT